MGPYATPPLATVRLTTSWSGMLFGVGPPAVLVATSHTSCGIGWRMNLPPVCIRIAGLPNLPVQVNEPLVVLRSIWLASASPGAQSHIRSGASIPRGHTVLSYGYRNLSPIAAGMVVVGKF